MLPVNIDNLSLYLKPPNGYRFQKGIATTYSLHLDTLLTIPMFLDGVLSDENAVIQNYASVVSSINKFRDRFQVYVQKGEIKTSSIGSKKASKLYELLREVIKEIPKDTSISSFHPKLWLLQYSNSNDFRYKLIILSKNLTNSQDLDIAVVFDGVKTKNNTQHSNINESLMYFLNNILDDSIFMQNELENIEWQNIDGYNLKNFYILPKDSKKLPFFNGLKIDKKSIVFSPFISNNIFEVENENILVTREEEVDKPLCQEIYTINSSLENTQQIDEEVATSLFDDDKESNNKLSINQLHAKIYISYPRTLIFGSANATNRGFKINNEILIELEAPSNFYIDTKKYIQNENNNFFVKLQKEYSSVNEDKDKILLNELLDSNKRIIINGIIKVEYEKENKQLILNSSFKVDDSIKIEVTPISKNSFRDYKNILVWKNIKYIDITGWFRFKLTSQSESREFLMNDECFQLDKQYLKSIEREASGKSEKYLEAHLISLLNDGRITSFEHRDAIQKDKDEEIHNYCSKQERNEDNLYDLLLDRFSSSKEHYNQALSIMKKLNKDGYKELLEILPKVTL